MTAQAMIFRFRAWIIVALYLIGFLAPWRRLFPAGPDVTLWLAASTWLARGSKIGIETSTVAVTLAALCCCWLGAAFRVWGSAYLGSGVVHNGTMQGGKLVASGPYRYLRNPLYLGSFLFALGVSILMPPSGALFFVIAIALVQSALIRGEEDFLAARHGDAYGIYRRSVPRLLPRIQTALAATKIRPRWLDGTLTEIFQVGFALCFAVLAWRYDASILMRCLLICYGLSLVARAIQPAQARAA